MVHFYGLTVETISEAPSLNINYGQKLIVMSQDDSVDGAVGGAEEVRERRGSGSQSLVQKQFKERGQRKPTDVIVETFVSPGDESWTERAAASVLTRKASSRSLGSSSKENTPVSKETTPVSKESTPASDRRTGKDSTPLSMDDKINFISGNPFVEVTKGIIHLFKQSLLAGTSSQQTPAVDTEMMCMYGVPAKHKTPDLLQLTAPCHQDLEYMRVVHDGSPNQYMVLLKFRDITSANEFHSAYNGLPYNNLEPEVCSVLPVSWVQHCKESDYFPDTQGGTELPYCTICLERMDESVSTVLTILCNHKFHSECLAQWEDPTCPVCRYVQTPEVVTDHLCLDCQSESDLWICLVCGYVGCGRYAGGHAHAHFSETQHCYSMELGHNRVWDYVGDNFVHRLVQNTGDGKLVEQEDSSGGGKQKQEGGLQSDVDGVIVCNEEKMDSLQLEYTYLLTSQLEDQRSYFQTKLGRVEEEVGRETKLMADRMLAAQEEKQNISKMLDEVKRDKARVENKLTSVTNKVNKLSSGLEEEKQLNSSLRQNQEEWQTKLKKAEIELSVVKESKDKEVQDLKDQVRDLMFYLEAQAKVQQSPLKGEIEEGQLIVGEASSGGGGATPRRGNKGARKSKK